MTMSEIKDSGNRREFSTGAVRDMAEGKGRCDLLPLDVIADLFLESKCEKYERVSIILNYLNSALEVWECETLSWDFNCMGFVVEHLYNALKEFLKQSDFGDIPTMVLELSVHFEQGANKYTEDNWKRGIPVNCYIDSAIRHYLKWLRGDTDERHDRAFVWNIVCCIWEVENHGKRNTDKTENACTDNAESGGIKLSER